MQKHLKILKGLLLAAIIVLPLPCHAANTQKVSISKDNRSLYFSGILKPIRIENVASPSDGSVMEKNFNYGDRVKKGDWLVKINSEKIEKDYNDALTGFLKAKDTLSTGKSKLESDKRLYDLGIISRDDYNSSRSSYASARITYQQSLTSLIQIAKTNKQQTDNLEQLNIFDFSKVDKALRIKFNFITLYASSDGIALKPPKKNEDDGNAQGLLAVGSELKQGQIITQVGNLTGLSAQFNVSELDVDSIKPGQVISMTGPGFPGITLQGKVKSIGSQANVQEGFSGGLPTFPVTVVVPKLSSAQQKIIRIGMSAKIKLTISEPKSIQVPISSVYQKNNKHYINVLKNKKTVATPVETGRTTAQTVIIKSGLSNGDIIIINPKNP